MPKLRKASGPEGPGKWVPIRGLSLCCNETYWMTLLNMEVYVWMPEVKQWREGKLS